MPGANNWSPSSGRMVTATVRVAGFSSGAMRVTSHLYDMGAYDGRRGLAEMRAFIEHRYAGTRPVLWGAQLPQTELAEILHVGLAGLDLIEDET